MGGFSFASGFPGGGSPMFGRMGGPMGGMGMGMNGMGGMMGGMGGGKRPFMSDVRCTLEELFTGTTKKLKITRQCQSAGREREHVFEVQVGTPCCHAQSLPALWQRPATSARFHREGRGDWRGAGGAVLAA